MTKKKDITEDLKELEKRVVEFDFRKTKDVGKEKIASLQVIFDAFSQKVASSLSAKLASTVQTKVLTVTQFAYADFAKTIQVPTVLGMIDMSPLKGMALIEVTPNVIFNFIDRLLGGKGEVISLTRGLTDIEFEVVEGIMGDFVKDLKNGWANVITLTPQVKRIESNPQFVQITSPQEKVLVGTIEVKTGETTGNMTLCLPFLTIEPIISKFTGEGEPALSEEIKSTASPEDMAKMRKTITDVNIPLIVELGKTEVTMRDMLELKEGDVMRLKTKVDEPLVMYANEIPKFKCRPGIIGTRIATQIIGRIESGGED
ncbi:MAG: flagellar motor switch protein FliM [bacterium]